MFNGLNHEQKETKNALVQPPLTHELSGDQIQRDQVYGEEIVAARWPFTASVMYARFFGYTGMGQVCHPCLTPSQRERALYQLKHTYDQPTNEPTGAGTAQRFITITSNQE